MSKVRNTLRSGYRLVLGGGEPGLLRRKEFHRRRTIAERAVLNEAKADPSMFRVVPCPACGSSKTSGGFTNSVGFSFAICACDGTIYMNPAPSMATLSRLYNDASHTAHWSVGHSAEPADYARVNKAIAPAAGQSLLDVGCSTGEFLKLARERFECHGVELNAETAAIARSNGFQVVTGTLFDVPGKDRFDVVTILQVIEHLVEPIEGVREIHRLLKPDGIFYLNTPTVESASFGLFRERHMHVSSFGHVSLFTKSGLDSLARRSGFTILAHGYGGGIDIALHDLIGWKFARSKFRHRVAFYSPRFLNGCNLIDELTFGGLTKILRPSGNESYQWALLRKA
jgi:SAM-dependent methyltransferase